MSSTIFSAGVLAAFVVGSLGQIVGEIPLFYPVITFGFNCYGPNTIVLFQCNMSTNANPVFVLGACGCTGSACSSYVNTPYVNDIMFLSTACRIELYEKDKLNGHNVISYTSLSALELTIDGYRFKSPTYTIPQSNNMVFGLYICKYFLYTETESQSLITDLRYAKCAPISNPTETFTDSSHLLTYMNQANPLLLFLPKTPTTMTIADKSYLPLGYKLSGALYFSTPFFASSGVFNTVTVTYDGIVILPESCVVRYSTKENSTLSVYTFAEMCTNKIMPSGGITGITASGSVPSEPADLCNGDTGTCVSQCLSIIGCVEALVENDPLDALVEGLAGDVTSVLSVVPSLGNNGDPITTLSNYIYEAATFNPY